MDHPGGFAIINDENGKDVTVLFEDNGHSNDARRCVQAFKVGRIAEQGEDSRGGCASEQQNVAQRAAKAKALADQNGFDRLSAAVSAVVFATTLLVWAFSS
jgi:cytochrome b involved in lipid metabolism